MLHLLLQHKMYMSFLTFMETSKRLVKIKPFQGIAYGTHHIVEHCNAYGHKGTCYLHAVAFQETVFVQEHADIIGCLIVLPRVLGTVILGAVAAKYAGLSEAMMALNAVGQGCMSSCF
eukprot:XP_015579655.1 uncharacterized protein LOC107261893 [Ricinus communis]